MNRPPTPAAPDADPDAVADLEPDIHPRERRADGTTGPSAEGASGTAGTGETVRRWGLFSIAVVVLSTVLHLVDLGRRPLAHDEAIDAWFSWQARSGGVMEYDPVYHGPLRFYLEGFVLNHFGTTPGWARLVAALAGIAATILIAGSVRLLGRFGAPLAALLFTVSPTVLTVTRTGREDSLTGLVSLGLLLLVAAALTGPRARHVVGGGLLVAISFTLKETTFIFGFAGACFFAGAGVVAWRRPRGTAREFFAGLRRLGAEPWMWSVVVFIAAFSFVFTSALRYPDGLRSGLVDGLEYWWSQQPVGRGSQRWFFYGAVYLAYEWLLLAAAAVGAIVTARRRSIVGAWFLTMAVVQFAVYSWASEKFAWLALHPLLPTVLLAGIGAQAVYDRLRRRSEGTPSWQVRAAAVAVALAVVGTTALAVRPAITDGADPSELLVTVQTSTSVPEINDRLADLRAQGRLGPILVDERDSGSWPWAWYLHGVEDVAFQSIDPAMPLPPGFDAYIVSASTDPPPLPAGYEIERFPLRVWWLPEYENMGVGDALRWWLTRETWSPTGSSDQYLIIRTTG
jgi:uncharacterized protein (TIGR03663 family)